MSTRVPGNLLTTKFPFGDGLTLVVGASRQDKIYAAQEDATWNGGTLSLQRGRALIDFVHRTITEKPGINTTYWIEDRQGNRLVYCHGKGASRKQEGLTEANGVFSF